MGALVKRSCVVSYGNLPAVGSAAQLSGYCPFRTNGQGSCTHGASQVTPKFSRHSSGQARVRVDGRVHYLGPYGSREALEKYSRLIDDWRQSADSPPASLSIAQLTLLYFRRCRKHYRKADQETSEVSNVRIAVRRLNFCSRDIQAAFTPKMLRTVRDRMVAEGYVRTRLNSPGLPPSGARAECPYRLAAAGSTAEGSRLRFWWGVVPIEAGCIKGQSNARAHLPERRLHRPLRSVIPHGRRWSR